jgi:hypothetical protein
LRLLLSEVFPDHWSQLMRHAADFRHQVHHRWPSNPDEKRACFERFVAADWKSMLEEENRDGIAVELERMLEPEY